MAKGRTGLWLEAWKFSIYLGVPLFASWYYSDPARQKASADYWKHVQYPPNPNTRLKEEIMETERRYLEQKKQMEAYKNQLRRLDGLATTNNNEDQTNESTNLKDNSTQSSNGFWSKLWSMGRRQDQS